MNLTIRSLYSVYFNVVLITFTLTFLYVLYKTISNKKLENYDNLFNITYEILKELYIGAIFSIVIGIIWPVIVLIYYIRNHY